MCSSDLIQAGVLIAMLIIQRYPQWVGLPSLDVNMQQAPQTNAVVQGPVTYADAVVIAAPAVVNLYTTKVVNKNARTRCLKTRSSVATSATTGPSSGAWSRAWVRA